MDTFITFGQLAAVLKDYGPFGILVVIWYLDIRQMRAMQSSYQSKIDEMQINYQSKMDQVLSEHKEYMAEIRRMYENNVILVEKQEKLSEDLKDIIIMNTQAMTHLSADIEQNQFCPANQIKKETVKVGR